MDSVVQVMKGLTKRQAAWFMGTTVLADGRALGTVAHFSLPDGTVRYYSAERDALTPLGLEVRARLLSSGGAAISSPNSKGMTK